MKLEICVDSMESVVNAEKGGADRLELCAGLSDGGLTPSLAFIERVIELSGLIVHVMLRPRNGDFCYSDEEYRVMLRDLTLIKNAGADGIVFGMLDSSGEIDKSRCRTIIKEARPMSVTFHRAFDMAQDPYESLDVLIELGADRILTSGKKSSAWEGRQLIGELVKRSGGQIVIMAGSGIKEENIAALVRETGVSECHASARSEFESMMTYRNTGLSMGSGSQNEYRRMITDPVRVKRLKIHMQM